MGLFSGNSIIRKSYTRDSLPHIIFYNKICQRFLFLVKTPPVLRKKSEGMRDSGMLYLSSLLGLDLKANSES